MAGTNYTADKTAYNAAIDNDISTQTGANTIPPEVVGAGYTDLSNLLEPYINRINNQAILSGSSVPSSLTGSDLDLYYRSQPTFFELYRKESGTWVLKVTINFSVTLPEGNLTVATSIDGFNALASKGGWVIANNVYQKATQTGILVDPADLNFYRHDIIYGNTSNQILYLQGTAAASPVAPTLPVNTILIDEIVVPSSSSGFDPYLLFGGSGVNNISIDDVILNQDGFDQPADFRISGTGQVGDLKITNEPATATGTDLVLFRDPSTGAVKAGLLTTFELGANKQNNLNYDGTATKYPTVDAINAWTKKIAEVATKTGLLAKTDTFNLTALDNFTARIAPVETAMFWNEIFTPSTSPSDAIKSFAQKDYSLGQLITATGGNVNVNPLGADGKYVRYLGYDKNGNVYSSLASFASNNDILQLGFVTVLKSGATVSFLDGTTGPRNVFPQPSLASNTDFDKVSSTVTNVTVGRKSDASFSTSAGTITGISVNWKSEANPTNSNPIDVFSVTSQATASFVVIDPTFLTSTSAITTHTLLTDTDGGIAINQSFYNTTTGLRGTMANGSAAVARIMVGVRGGIFWQMGEFATTACYADLTTAKNNIYSHVFSEAIVPPGVAFEIARVAFTKSANVTNNDAQFYLVNTSGGGSSSSSVSPVGDATTVTKGILKLAGDLGGTADLPEVTKLTTTPSSVTLSTAEILFRDPSTGGFRRGSPSLFIQNTSSSPQTSANAWLGGGGETLKVGTNTGLSDFAYIGIYARQSTPTTQSGSIGYLSAGQTTLSIQNSITGGSINIIPSTTGVIGLFGNNSQVAQVQGSSGGLVVLPISGSNNVNSFPITFNTTDSGGITRAVVMRGTISGTTASLTIDNAVVAFYRSSSSAPSTSDIASGYYSMWKNTTSGEVRLYANDGGTLKSVLLT